MLYKSEPDVAWRFWRPAFDQTTGRDIRLFESASEIRFESAAISLYLYVLRLTVCLSICTFLLAFPLENEPLVVSLLRFALSPICAALLLSEQSTRIDLTQKLLLNDFRLFGIEYYHRVDAIPNPTTIVLAERQDSHEPNVFEISFGETYRGLPLLTFHRMTEHQIALGIARELCKHLDCELLDTTTRDKSERGKTMP